MLLHELLQDLPVRTPAANPDVTGVCHDSRRVADGDLFVAIVGESFDGRRFSTQAVERGAVAVAGPDPAPSFPPGRRQVPWIAVDEPRLVLGPLAARVYGRPHEELRLVGVTGTNGKGTVSRLVMRVLEAAGEPCGLGGTLGYEFADRDYLAAVGYGELDSGAGPRTTLEASDLIRVLRRMADDGARAMAMEVSSHGLAMDRVTGLEFDLAIFTNLSRDHLDFHGDLESYFAAKRRLFDKLAPTGKVVVCINDEWGRRLAGELRMSSSQHGLGEDAVLTCGENDGDVHVVASRLGLDGIEARLATPRGELAVRSHLLGRFNLWNVVTAVAAGEALGLDRETIAAGIAAEVPLPGRMESVDAGQGFPALVDYSHTPEGLKAALESLRELSGRRIAVVFGCGGDKDRGKRPQMGKIATELADLAIATSDNPRSEDPEAILDQVEVGLREGGGPYRRLADRREAIRAAVALAASRHDDAEWTVLVAGKGHESIQEIGERRIPFSDRGEIEGALKEEGDG